MKAKVIIQIKADSWSNNNLENSNAEFIKLGINQRERLIKLNESARNQMEVLKNNNGIKELEILQKQINASKHLIETKWY